MYVSFLCNSRDVKGVLVNNYCLKKLGNRREYVCVLTEDVDSDTVDILTRNGIKLQKYNFESMLRMESIAEPLIKEIIENKTLQFWGKFLVFKNQSTDCVYLDSDI